MKGKIIQNVNTKLSKVRLTHFLDTLFFYFVHFFIFYNIKKVFRFLKELKFVKIYITSFDYYNETGKKEYLHLAKTFRNILIKRIEDHGSKVNFINAEKGFWPYWSYEKKLKDKILSDKTVSFNEIRRNLLLKSADTYIEMSILQNYTRIDESIAEFFHYRRALCDLTDDMRDVSEDLKADNPNTVIMLLMKKEKYKDLKRKNKKALFSLIRKYNIILQLDKLSNFFHREIKNLRVLYKFQLLIKMHPTERDYNKMRKLFL